jgi:ketosteroid isomerase-like protein
MLRPHHLVALILLAAPVSLAQAQARPGPGPEAGLSAFLEALNSLDRTAMADAFAEDATAFFPRGFPGRRIEGRAAIADEFGRFFDSARSRGASRLNVAPGDVRVQRYGDLAVATFHLGGSGADLGRRTAVLRRDGARWRLVHLHASAQPAQP